MAVMKMTPVKGELNKVTAFSLEAATAAADGFVFEKPRVTDEYIVVVVHNSGNAEYDITVKAPDTGSYAAAGADESFAVAAGGYGIFRFESAVWANRDGTIRLVPENVAVKAAVLY